MYSAIRMLKGTLSGSPVLPLPDGPTARYARFLEKLRTAYNGTDKPALAEILLLEPREMGNAPK